VAGRSVHTSRPVGIFTLAITGLIGGAGVYLAATRPDNRVFNLFLGLLMLSVALMTALGLRRSAHGWRATELDGRPAWAMPVGQAGQVPAFALVATVLGLGLAVGAFTVDSTGVGVLVGVVAAFMLVLAAEMWRIWLRRPELRLGVDRIQLHGTGIDAELGWDDVGAVVHENLGTRWGGLVVTAAGDAPSYRHDLKRFLLPTDRVPDPPGIHLRFGLIADERQLRRVLRDMHVGGRAGREAMISRGLPDASGY
jgi:uncharacterized membrane protein YfcA